MDTLMTNDQSETDGFYMFSRTISNTFSWKLKAFFFKSVHLQVEMDTLMTNDQSETDGFLHSPYYVYHTLLKI